MLNYRASKTAFYYNAGFKTKNLNRGFRKELMRFGDFVTPEVYNSSMLGHGQRHKAFAPIMVNI